MMTNIELAIGERMVVYEKAVIVFGKTEKRIYNLKGELIGRSNCAEEDLKEFCIFFDKCLAIKEDTKWKLLDYNGNVLYGKKTLKIEYCSQNTNWFKLLEKEENMLDFVGAIYSKKGECILPYGEHQRVIIKGATLFANYKIYDSESKSYIGDEWEFIHHLEGYSIAKSDGKYYIYDHYTRKIEMCIDAYIYEYPFVKIYKNNFCGLMTTLKKGRYSSSLYSNKEYLVLPIKYRKITIHENYVEAYASDGKVEKYNKSELLVQKEVVKCSRNIGSSTNKSIEIKLLLGIKLKEGEELKRYENFFVLKKIDGEIYKYFYYTPEGKFIGKSGSLIIVDGDYEGECNPNFISTEKWLALGGDEEISLWRSDHYSNWEFYNYNGTKAFDFTIEKIEKEKGYYFLKIKNRPERLVCDSKGNVLFSIVGNYREINLSSNKQYFIAILPKVPEQCEKFEIYNFKGKKVFEKIFKHSHRIEFIENIIFYGKEEDDGENNEFVEYDITTGRILSTLINDLDEVTLPIFNNSKLYIFESNGKMGLYEYTSERSGKNKFIGFKEIIPIIYNDINDGWDQICAEADDGEDVYDYSGKLIATTRR